MMPDPNSLTSGTPRARSVGDLLYGFAVRLLATDRVAELRGEHTSRWYVVAKAQEHGLTEEDIATVLEYGPAEAAWSARTGVILR